MKKQKKEVYTEQQAAIVCKKEMPKEMSDWFDERFQKGQYTKVGVDNMIGCTMKSRDCIVVLFPGCNSDK